MLNESLVMLIEGCIVFGHHVAAAAPGLVADCKVIDGPGLFPAVRTPQVSHGRHAVEGHVLDPLAHLADRAGSYIAVDVCLASQLLSQIHELMRSEAVVLGDAAPVGVDHLLTVLLGTDAVLPVVLVGKTAAGPAQNGDLHLLQGFDDIVPHAAGIGDGRVFSDIYTFVNASAEMLGEMALYLRVYVSFFLIGIDD